ncbi:MAG: hypothetical protein V6D39_02120 [Dolichospermum lemmermannii FEM_B0920]|jgi:hypothetical protein
MPKRIQFHLDENVDPDIALAYFFLCVFAPLRETKTVIHLPKNSYQKVR